MRAAVLAASDPVLLAAIPVIGVVAAALIAGIFGQAGRRSAEVDQARRDLVDDMTKRIEMLEKERNELRVENMQMEAKIRQHEHRPTRGKP